jgi:hypothetical protein
VEAKLLQDIQQRQSQQKSTEMVAFKVTSQVGSKASLFSQ